MQDAISPVRLHPVPSNGFGLSFNWIAISLLGHIGIVVFALLCGAFPTVMINKQNENKPLIASLYQAPAHKSVDPKILEMAKMAEKKRQLEEKAAESYKVRDLEIPPPSTTQKTESSPTSSSEESVSHDSILSDIRPLAQNRVTEEQNNPAIEQNSISNKPHSNTSEMDDVQKKIDEQKRRILEKKKASMDWMSMFPSLVADQIQKNLPDYILKQKVTCHMRLRLTEDGTLLEATPVSGDEILCTEAQRILNKIGHFDVPELIPEHAKHLRDLTVKIGPWFLD